MKEIIWFVIGIGVGIIIQQNRQVKSAINKADIRFGE